MIINTIFNPQDSVAWKKKPGYELIVDKIKIEIAYFGDLETYPIQVMFECKGKNNGLPETHDMNDLIEFDPNWQYEYCKREIEQMPEWKKEIYRRNFGDNSSWAKNK